jgi:hypothetical protein
MTCGATSPSGRKGCEKSGNGKKKISKDAGANIIVLKSREGRYSARGLERLPAWIGRGRCGKAKDEEVGEQRGELHCSRCQQLRSWCLCSYCARATAGVAPTDCSARPGVPRSVAQAPAGPAFSGTTSPAPPRPARSPIAPS